MALALALGSCAPVPELDARAVDERLASEGRGTVTTAGQREQLASHPAEVQVERCDDGALLATLGVLPFAHFRSSAVDMSDDGSVIVGNGTFEAGHVGFRWTEQDGMQPIPKSTHIIGISASGRLILGVEKSRTNTPWDNYVLWEDVDKPPRIVVPLDHEPTFETQYELVKPLLVLDDGSMYGWCLLYGNPDGPGGCHVDASGALTSLGSATVNVADLAGNHGGKRDAYEHSPNVVPAYLNGEYLGTVGACTFDDCEAAVQDFSAGAKVAVGTGIEHTYRREGEHYIDLHLARAFVHTADDPMRPLPDLPGERENAGAYAVSEDGAIIGGYGHDPEGQHAVVWIGRAPHRLRDLITAAGGSLPSGYRPFEVRSVSADGRVFAGNGVHADGTRAAFRACLPRRP